MRKVRIPLRLFTATLLTLLLGSSGFSFQNEPEGFRGLTWGAPPTEDMVGIRPRTIEARLLGKEGVVFEDKFDLHCYRRKNDKMSIGRVNLDGIYYLFYDGRFMEVVIIQSYSDVRPLKDIVDLKFGEGEYRGRGEEYSFTFGGEWVWQGEIATIILTAHAIGFCTTLRIYSTKIHDQSEEELPGKKQEERQKVAEEALDDF